MSDEKNVDVWLRMYEEQTRHIRHHELMRTQATNLVVVISAALLALYGTKTVEVGALLIGPFIAAVNLYGLLMSMKHYERSLLHASVGSAYRAKVSEHSAIDGQSINDVRHVAHEKHAMGSRMSSVRAHWLWSGLHGLLILAGLVIALKP